MQTSSRIAKTRKTRPMLSELKGSGETFMGKTDFELQQQRRRKEHKPERRQRTDWHEKASI